MKQFKELTIEELEIVFNKNEKLQDEVLSAAQEDASYWINEYLSVFDRGTLEYNIGYPGDYIRVENEYDFIQGLKKLQKNYCYLSEESEKTIVCCDSLMDRYNNLSYSDYKNADRLENRIDELITELKADLLKQLVNEYNYYYNTDHLQEYFIELYSDNMGDQYYIDDDFILYQHIEYEKSYK